MKIFIYLYSDLFFQVKPMIGFDIKSSHVEYVQYILESRLQRFFFILPFKQLNVQKLLLNPFLILLYL